MIDEAAFAAAWAPLASRAAFSEELGRAVREGRGFATGKLGGSEVAFLQHALVEARESDPRRRRAFDIVLAVLAGPHSGIFPTDPASLEAFCAEFAWAAAQLDVIGLFPERLGLSLDVLRHHRLPGTVMHFLDQEPDRSVPADDAGCWLGHLRGRDVLLVCPFANLLRRRATEETFEAVWAKTGKRWFEPAAVRSLEQPYGFDPQTAERFGTALALLDDLRTRIDAIDFDVALIAAGGLGIPLAAHVKAGGRVAVSLGGHLQVLFGVLGARWRDDPVWQRRYINDAWVDLPPRYRPDPSTTRENYW